MSREIMQQALDALRRVGEYGDIYRYKNTEQSPYTQIYEAIDAINVELAKPEQEPVAQIRIKNGHWIDTPRSAKTKSLPDGLHDLYTAPPRKEWVGLTDEEIKEVLDLNVAPWSLSGVALQHVMDDARALEAKLKEKNGG
jgi:hypothetical protein